MSDNTRGRLPSVSNYCAPQNAEKPSVQAHLQQGGRKVSGKTRCGTGRKRQAREGLHPCHMLSDLTLHTHVTGSHREAIRTPQR